MRLSAFLILFLLLVTPGFSARVATSKTETLLLEARQLFADAKDAQALKKYEEILQYEPMCYEALCKASLINSRIGSRFLDMINRLYYFDKAWKYADAALCVEESDAESNYVMALAVYNKAMTLGARERLRRTKDIKFYLDASLKDDSKHGEAWQLLGRWYFKNANLNVAEKATLNFLYQGAPKDITNAKAMEALQNAVLYNPGNITAYYDLALVYREVKDISCCEYTLKQALKLNLVTAEELDVNRRCKTLLTKLEKS